MPTYTQALMDLGSQICRIKKPNCEHCPLKSTCYAHKQQITDQLPEKNRATKRKIQKAHWFWIEREQNGERQVLLQQQPQNGIWGGLWAFPAVNFDFSCQNPPPEPKNARKLASIKHLFTHITLYAELFQAQHGAALPPTIAENLTAKTQAWFTAQDLNELALPRPVAQLLRQWLSPNENRTAQQKP